MYRPYIIALSIQRIIRRYYHDPRMPLMERTTNNIARLLKNFRFCKDFAVEPYCHTFDVADCIV